MSVAQRCRVAPRAVRDLLGGRHYSAEQVRAAAAVNVYEVEPALVEAGTYYVAEIDGAVVAGGGWSAGGAMQPLGVGSGVGRLVIRAALTDAGRAPRRWNRGHDTDRPPGAHAEPWYVANL